MRALGVCPGFGGDVFDPAGGHRGQSCEDVAEVDERVDAPAAAAFDDGVEDGSALAGFGGSYEEPVLFADGGGADGVFHEVVVDFDPSVDEVAFEFASLLDGVADGPADSALWEVVRADSFEFGEDVADDGCALGCAHCEACGGSGALFAQLIFDLVEPGDLVEDCCCGFAAVFLGVVKWTPGVCPAACEGDGFGSGGSVVLADEGAVGGVSVALQCAAVVCGDDASLS